MRAVQVSAPGGADQLAVADMETPLPASGEVQIKVAASGINRADILQRQGFYPPPPGASEILGLEVSGVITALGDGVAGWSVGDRVCALLSGGGYAEYAVVSADACLTVPETLSLVDAAALPEAVMTVWSNVMDRCRIQPGERFLVHGGSSGIGTAAIQMLSAYGCDVYATAGSEEKVSACEALGAKRCINYREQDFVQELLAETGGDGIDVILDMVGGDYVNRNIELAAVEGRIVNIAFQLGALVETNLLSVMLKRLLLTGSTLRARDDGFKTALTQSIASQVWPWLEEGRLQPVVYQTFAPEHAGDAHDLMESSGHIGKLLLVWE